MNLVFFKSHCRSQRDDVTVKGLLHPQGGSQPSVVPVLGVQCPLLASMVYIHVGKYSHTFFLKSHYFIPTLC